MVTFLLRNVTWSSSIPTATGSTSPPTNVPPFCRRPSPAPREVRTLCHVLHDTGCRLSEALALPMRGVDLAGKVLRHGFGVADMLCKWMGHVSTETTAIYANAVGEEEQSIAARMWG